MRRRNSVLTFVAVWAATLLVSCSGGNHREIKASRADSALFDVGTLKAYDRMLAMADSFEMVGDLTPLDANRWRGVAYYHQGQYRMAEICYRKALECEAKYLPAHPDY